MKKLSIIILLVAVVAATAATQAAWAADECSFVQAVPASPYAALVEKYGRANYPIMFFHIYKCRDRRGNTYTHAEPVVAYRDDLLEACDLRLPRYYRMEIVNE